MSKDNFILHDIFNIPLSKKEFEVAKKSYLKTLEENNYSIKNASNIYELINNIKRTPQKVGPYQNISVFEALNRIGSDLVLLSGATALFNNKLEGIKPEKIHLKMGTTHGFDFEVFLKNGKVVYGEAFNAAESFCKHKMRQAIHKLTANNAKEGIIFVNEAVKPVIEKYVNKKEYRSKTKIYKIYCGMVR